MLPLQTRKIYHSHLITPRSVVVVFDSGLPAVIPVENSAYGLVCGLLRSGQYESVPEAVDVALRVKTQTKGKFVVVNGAVNIDGEMLPKALSDKLMDMVDKKEETSSLENFWDNLSQNPCDSSREDLFAFIEANNIPLTKDGCFIVYKKVRDNFLDSYSGTIDNTPGLVVEIERESVDHDRRNTCSHGLHVAAWEYASNFSGNRLLEVKVNPRDVVAVPPDYNQQKMRVCKYEVLREATQKYTENVYVGAVEKTNRIVNRVSSAVVSRDSEGRLRVPSSLMRGIGVGVGKTVEVIVPEGERGRLIVRALSKDTTPDGWRTYIVQSDNSIRISEELLEEAEIVAQTYSVLQDGDTLEVLPK